MPDYVAYSINQRLSEFNDTFKYRFKVAYHYEIFNCLCLFRFIFCKYFDDKKCRDLLTNNELILCQNYLILNELMDMERKFLNYLQDGKYEILQKPSKVELISKCLL